MNLNHAIVVFLWVLLLVILLCSAWLGKRPVAGLGICHWFCQAINHFFGEVLVKNSGEDIGSRQIAETGFEITGYAISGLILAWLISNQIWTPKVFPSLDKNFRENYYAGIFGAVFGFLIYFVFMNFLAFIPSITAFTSGGLPMMAGAIGWLFLMEYYKFGLLRGMFVVLLGFLIPVSTLILRGFMGYGLYAFFAVISIVFCYLKPRFLTLIFIPLFLFFGLSLYPSYMDSRAEIREKAWGDVSLLEKAEVTFQTIFDNWQWFDSTDTGQLSSVNGRLNQNTLLGASYYYINSGNIDYAYGETLSNAIYSLVPRAVWYNKTLNAGSGNLASKYTGMTFGDNTSVGIGNMMELFVNFGEIGVFVGFLIIGLIIYSVDGIAGLAIQSRDYSTFFIYFIPGQALMNSIGSFQEWGPSFVGSLVLSKAFCFLYNKIMTPSKPNDP